MTDAFFTLHKDLPREGPGDRESLDWAIGLAGLPRNARILDAACGPGADIEDLLAHAPDGQITAIDLHPDFIEQVQERWGDEIRVTTAVGDMAAETGPFDLIWCAGALYFLGISEGLRGWTSALAPSGVVAFSELVWLVDNPDPALKAANEAEYAEIAGIDTMKARIEAAGYEICGLKVLSDEAWEAYYTPMEVRIARLRPGASAELAKVLDEGSAEIALWRKYRDQFGYALAVVRPK